MTATVFSMFVIYYFIHFEFISVQADQLKFKKVLHIRQIISITFLLKQALKTKYFNKTIEILFSDDLGI